MKTKYIMAFCAAAIALASCNKENNVVTPGDDMEVNMNVVREQNTTRAAWNEGVTSFSWSNDDHIAFYAPGIANVQQLTYSEKKNAFTGVLTTSTEAGTWFAVFPTPTDVEDPTYSLTGQSGSLADFSNKYDIMVAKCENIEAGKVPKELSMEHKMALLEVTNNLSNPVQLVARDKRGKVITGVSFNEVYGEVSTILTNFTTGGDNPYICEVPSMTTCYVAVPTNVYMIHDNKPENKATVINKNVLNLVAGKKYSFIINNFTNPTITDESSTNEMNAPERE